MTYSEIVKLAEDRKLHVLSADEIEFEIDYHNGLFYDKKEFDEKFNFISIENRNKIKFGRKISWNKDKTLFYIEI